MRQIDSNLDMLLLVSSLVCLWGASWTIPVVYEVCSEKTLHLWIRQGMVLEKRRQTKQKGYEKVFCVGDYEWNRACAWLRHKWESAHGSVLN